MSKKTYKMGGRPKHSLAKTLSPEMSIEEKLNVAALGNLAGNEELIKKLREFFSATHEKESGHQWRFSEEDQHRIEADLSRLLLSALRSRDTSFFELIAQLIPISSEVGGGVNKMDVDLINLLKIHEEEEPGSLLRINLDHFFQSWPPSISELKRYLNTTSLSHMSGLYDVHEKSIRDSVKRIGFPTRRMRKK
jgi:hypothetical protein